MGPSPHGRAGLRHRRPRGGLVAACVITEYGPQGRPDLGAVGMVLVAARHARRGVGRRMMRHVMSTMGTTPLTLYATPYGRPLYEELGFKVIGRAEMVCGHFTPEAAPSAVATPGGDRRGPHPHSPARRGGVRGRPDSPLARLPAFADQLRVAEDNGRLIGYAAAWPNMDTHVVGPLIARDTETAKALVASLATHTDRPLRTDVDLRHEELLGWLKERGLAPVVMNDVMTYGIGELPGDWSRRFAPLTVAAG